MISLYKSDIPILQSKYRAILEWCSEHSSKDAPLLIKSYCATTFKTRRSLPEQTAATTTGSGTFFKSTDSATTVRSRQTGTDLIADDTHAKAAGTVTTSATKTEMTMQASTLSTTTTTVLLSQKEPEVQVTTFVSFDGTHRQYYKSTITLERFLKARETTPLASKPAPTTPNTPPSPAQLRSTPPNRLHRLLKRLDLSKWGVSNTDHPLETGTASIYLYPHVHDCVKNTHTCIVLLPMIGACCGIIFGAILYAFLQWCLPRWWAHRKAKKELKAAAAAANNAAFEAVASHAQKAGRDAAGERSKLHFEAEGLKKFLAKGGKVKQPELFWKKHDPDVMDMNPDGTYG
jgi:hypothetical protein